jgi:shikimate dehydrogenase
MITNIIEKQGRKQMTEINGATVVCATLAKPNKASTAPAMHNSGFRHLGLNYVYVAFEPDDIGAALRGVQALGFGGVSISAPYKQAAMEFVDELDETARNIGAINTVKNDDGRLIGYNSDWIGAIRALEEKTTLDGKNVALLGAGGAARAISYGLKTREAAVSIFDRTAARGQSLAADLELNFGGDLAEATDSRADIVINATSIGMNSTDDIPVSNQIFESAKLVMDIVVRPRRTAFLERAEKHGVMTVQGVRMLVHQGAWTFELFTGIEAPLEVMFSTVTAALE